jgi:glutaredoxin-like protein NrdH
MCEATKRLFEKSGVEYQEIDVMVDESAMQHVADLGFFAAPVVETDELTWAGLRPDLIEKVAQKVSADCQA